MVADPSEDRPPSAADRPAPKASEPRAAPPDGDPTATAPSRRRRRARTAPPPGSDPSPAPEPSRHDPTANDDRLRADKPPHY